VADWIDLVFKRHGAGDSLASATIVKLSRNLIAAEADVRKGGREALRVGPDPACESQVPGLRLGRPQRRRSGQGSEDDRCATGFPRGPGLSLRIAQITLNGYHARP
jgi:hypothetical protein